MSHKFFFAKLALTFFLFISLSNSCFAEKFDCGKILTKTAQVIALPVTWPWGKITKYYGEVRDQGSERIYGPLRREPEKFSWRNYFSVTDLVSRHRIQKYGAPPIQRRPGLIITTLITILIFDFGHKGIIGFYDRGFDNAMAVNIYSADTIQNWMASGVMTPNEGRKLFERFKDEFAHNLAPLRQRKNDFVEKGWWSPEAGVLASSILDDLVKQNSRDQLLHTNVLAEKIAEHPKFRDLTQSISTDLGFTITLWLTPQIDFLGKPDTFWLSKMLKPEGLSEIQKAGLRSLKPYFEADLSNDSLVPDIELIATTLSETKLIEAKIKKAATLGLPASLDTFARVDLPPFAKPESFPDVHKTITLNDEIDRWNLIFKDPRFTGFKEAWLKHELSDQEILFRFTLFLDSSTFRFADSTSPVDIQNSCQMIFGTKELSGVPMFSNLKMEVSGLAHEQQESLALMRLKLYVDSFLQASRDPQNWVTIFQKIKAEENALMANARKGQLPSDAAGSCSKP